MLATRREDGAHPPARRGQTGRSFLLGRWPVPRNSFVTSRMPAFIERDSSRNRTLKGEFKISETRSSAYAENDQLRTTAFSQFFVAMHAVRDRLQCEFCGVVQSPLNRVPSFGAAVKNRESLDLVRLVAFFCMSRSAVLRPFIVFRREAAGSPT